MTRTDTQESTAEKRDREQPIRTAKVWATGISPYKTLLEFGALLAATVYGIGLAVRTWPYPTADLEVQVVHVAMQSRIPTLVASAKLSLGDSSNIHVESLKTTCKVLSGSGSCHQDCGDIESELKAGVLAKGDGFSWACKVAIPPMSCVRLTQELRGRGSGLAFGSSRWWSNTVHCDGGLQNDTSREESK